MNENETSPVPPQPKSRVPKPAVPAPAAKTVKTRKKRVLSALEQQASIEATCAQARLHEAKKLGALIEKASKLSRWGKDALSAALNPVVVES